jgi:hypothetical protein
MNIPSTYPKPGDGRELESAIGSGSDGVEWIAWARHHRVTTASMSSEAMYDGSPG